MENKIVLDNCIPFLLFLWVCVRLYRERERAFCDSSVLGPYSEVTFWLSSIAQSRALRKDNHMGTGQCMVMV
ncbi:hypothetical protein RJT34_02962 [Clitoria ternatea]|uniref:Uncharacterized protein n=1 Tax=Clitoria ternatea TaxID=43366 RepID=A0AAN9KL78_CLITE